MTQSQQPWHTDDIVVWPRGSWTTVGDVYAGDHSWKSDDYEIVRLEDVERLTALGFADDLDIS